MSKANGKSKTLKNFRPQRINSNKHKPVGLGALRNSIGRYGIGDGITVARDGESISGSARLETLAEIMPGVKIVEIETDGNTLVVNRRIDIPTANSPRARALSAASNIVNVLDYNPDGAILAAIAAEEEVIKQMIAAEDASRKAVMEIGESSESIPEMELQLNESYDYIVLVFRSQLDFLQALDVFQIGKSKVSIRDDLKKYGLGRCINGERVLSMIKHE